MSALLNDFGITVGVNLHIVVLHFVFVQSSLLYYNTTVKKNPNINHENIKSKTNKQTKMTPIPTRKGKNKRKIN